MRYFSGCKNRQELKSLYRKLALQYHPDCGGSEAVMKAINVEFQEMYARLKDQKQKEGESQSGTASEYMDIIDKIIGLAGIAVELCGSWLWITGDTKQHKTILKNAGCKWANKKSAWYWHPAGYVRTHRKSFSMQEIRQLHGSQPILANKEDQKRLLTV